MYSTTKNVLITLIGNLSYAFQGILLSLTLVPTTPLDTELQIKEPGSKGVYTSVGETKEQKVSQNAVFPPRSKLHE